jgi:hypothetical protein
MEENEIKDAAEKIEKGLKAVSDETMVEGQRAIRGVMRVGPAAKGILLSSERQVHLGTLIILPIHYPYYMDETVRDIQKRFYVSDSQANFNHRNFCILKFKHVFLFYFIYEYQCLTHKKI